MKTQREYLNVLLKIQNDNFGVEEFVLIDGSEVGSCNWSIRKISKVEESLWFETSYGEVFTDEEAIKTYIKETADDIPDEKLEAYIDSVYAEKVKKVVCIFSDVR